jgi:hypothetical protein
VLKRIFGPKRDEIIGGLKKLHNKEVHNANCSPNIIIIIKLKKMRWVGHVARMGMKRNACGILVGKLEGKRPLVRSRHTREDNIIMDIRIIKWGGMGCINLDEGRTSRGLL